MKKIRVLDYGKFEQTKISDLSKLVNMRRCPKSLFMSRVINGDAYTIMVRSTCDHFGVIFWSSCGSQQLYFTLIDSEIESHIERITPEA